LELLAAAGSTAITELTLPLPSCLLLLNDDAATSGGGAAAAGTASVAIPNYLLQAFSRKNPLFSSLSSSSFLLLLNSLRQLLKKSDKTQLLKCNFHTTHTHTHTHTLSLFAIKISATKNVRLRNKNREICLYNNPQKKTKYQRMGLGVLFSPEAHEVYVIS